MRFGSRFMGTQISAARAAAAIVGLLIALALSRDVAAQPAELRVLSSAAPRSILNEMSPVFERMTGRKLVVEYAFSPDLKRRIEAGDPFDVAILPPDMADDLMGRYKLVAGSRVDLGRTGLGVAVRKGASPPDVSTADALRAAFLAAPTVAYADGGQSGVQFHAILARLESRGYEAQAAALSVGRCRRSRGARGRGSGGDRRLHDPICTGGHAGRLAAAGVAELYRLYRQHRRGGEAAAGSANAAKPAHIADRDRAVQGAGL
jgi:hypothetical protein